MSFNAVWDNSNHSPDHMSFSSLEKSEYWGSFTGKTVVDNRNCVCGSCKDLVDNYQVSEILINSNTITWAMVFRLLGTGLSPSRELKYFNSVLVHDS